MEAPKRALAGGSLGGRGRVVGFAPTGAVVQERVVSELEAHQSGRYVVGDQARLDVAREHRTGRTLVIAILNHRNRRVRVAEHAALGRDIGVRQRRGGDRRQPVLPRAIRQIEQDQDKREEDGGCHRPGKEEPASL